MALTIQTLSVGHLQTQCYLVSRAPGEAVVVIDPGAEGARIRQAVGERALAAILLTHGHFDHIGGIRELAQADTPILVHALDADMLSDPQKNVSSLFGSVTAPPATRLVQEGEQIEIAGMTLTVLHTPGHTPGSVCYQGEGALFTGDTLFHSGYGRTDLPGGSEVAMHASLKRLVPLAEKQPIYPGH